MAELSKTYQAAMTDAVEKPDRPVPEKHDIFRINLSLAFFTK